MGNLWIEMGYIRYPLAFSLVAVVALSAYSASRLFRATPAADVRTKTWIDAVLFWGVFAAIAGVLGTLIGVIIASQFLEHAAVVDTRLVWGGFRVALLSAAFGALILAGAALSWFGLQLRWRLVRGSYQPSIAPPRTGS